MLPSFNEYFVLTILTQSYRQNICTAMSSGSSCPSNVLFCILLYYCWCIQIQSIDKTFIRKYFEMMSIKTSMNDIA